jgi:hypothetical protein
MHGRPATNLVVKLQQGTRSQLFIDMVVHREVHSPADGNAGAHSSAQLMANRLIAELVISGRPSYCTWGPSRLSRRAEMRANTCALSPNGSTCIGEQGLQRLDQSGAHRREVHNTVQSGCKCKAWLQGFTVSSFICHKRKRCRHMQKGQCQQLRLARHSRQGAAKCMQVKAW